MKWQSEYRQKVNMQEEDTRVQVRFVTQQRKYAITEAAIFVPARLRRYGLSEIVNHLLGAGKENALSNDCLRCVYA